MKAVCLLSGGLDSAVCAAIAKSRGYELFALTFNYNQKHSREIDSAKKLVRYMEVKEHKILDMNFLEKIEKSALMEGNVPTGKSYEEIKKSEDIPSTYVPARNIIFLSCGLAYAESIDAEAVFMGANAVDYSNYPDCRPEFIQKFQEVARVGTKKGVEGKEIKIKIPLLKKSKAEIIERGSQLGVPFELTWSCYKGGERACGECEACVLRLKGFEEAGLEDPLEYEQEDKNTKGEE